MKSCKRCGSFAVNPNDHGRDPKKDLDLCDVCYWRKQAEEGEQMNEFVGTLNEIIHDQGVAMQAAWIEWKHGKGAEAAMQWIEAELEGPGHIPDDSDQFHDNADMWYASNISDPFPTCWCGMVTHKINMTATREPRPKPREKISDDEQSPILTRLFR